MTSFFCCWKVYLWFISVLCCTWTLWRLAPIPLRVLTLVRARMYVLFLLHSRVYIVYYTYTKCSPARIFFLPCFYRSIVSRGTWFGIQYTIVYIWLYMYIIYIVGIVENPSVVDLKWILCFVFRICHLCIQLPVHTVHGSECWRIAASNLRTTILYYLTVFT